MENNVLRKNKVRNSSLELLRILCMFFIILRHYSAHGGYGEFTAANLTAGVIIVQLISMFGRDACSVFALITGYFMIHSAKDTPKKSLILMTEMVFYSWIINAILFATGQVEFTLRGLLIAVFPMIWGRTWYVLAYVIFLLFVPYVNRFIKALDKKTFTGLLALIFVFFSFLKTFAKAGWEFSDFDFFIVFYLAGAYIRLYADDLKYKNSINLIVMLVSAALLLLTVPVMDFAGVITGIDTFVNMAVYFRDYYCPIGIVLAVSSFLFFKNIEFHSAVINQSAKSMLAIYLIHEGARETIWQTISPNANYLNTPWLVPHIIIKCACVFFGGLIIDQIRLATIGRLTESFINKKYPIWTEKCIKIRDRFLSFIKKHQKKNTVEDAPANIE